MCTLPTESYLHLRVPQDLQLGLVRLHAPLVLRHLPTREQRKNNDITHLGGLRRELLELVAQGGGLGCGERGLVEAFLEPLLVLGGAVALGCSLGPLVFGQVLRLLQCLRQRVLLRLQVRDLRCQRDGAGSWAGTYWPARRGWTA